MISKKKLKISFGKAHHGWLPTTLIYGDFKLELDISDVPLDPMKQLCTALIELLKGIQEPIKVIWHLEPYCYYLQLKQSKSLYQISLLESKDFDGPMTLNRIISGDFKGIILPLYRGLKAFCSQAYEAPHWEPLEVDRMVELTNLVREKKALLKNIKS